MNQSMAEHIENIRLENQAATMQMRLLERNAIAGRSAGGRPLRRRRETILTYGAQRQRGTAALQSSTDYRWQVVITLVAALLTGSLAAAPAGAPPLSSVRTEKSVETLALVWFARMQTGQIDRTQLAAEYNAQLTDDAVQAMSRFLKEHDYGASPTGAQVLKTSTVGEQTFYVVKLLFPRGDAASLLLGFNAEGKITGINLMSMAGD
jgi:hypothetical protein